MDKRTVGLALGKFAPLHKGHQFVLDIATEQTDAQVFVIYDSPATTSIPLGVRANWIRALYPKAEVIQAWGGPEQVGLNPELMRAHESFLREVLGGRQITHFFNSEAYGEHTSKSLGAIDVQVDPNRIQFPVSGTDLRKTPFSLRQFLSPVVLSDLITKVVFLGAPSTGKSSMARAAAERLETTFMPEYGREYWEKHAKDRRLTMDQLEEIAKTHRMREEQLLKEANQTIFVDTDASTTAVFADYYHGTRSPLLEQLSLQAVKRYDLTFLCLPDFPYADTEDRSGEANQIEFQHRILSELRAQRRPFIELAGTPEERLERVLAVLSSIGSFANPADWKLNV